MPDILLSPIIESDLEELERWHSAPEVSTRYGSADWPRKLFQFTKEDSNRTCWVIREDGRLIGYIDCEVRDSIAWIGLVVNPALHNQGRGKRILGLFVASPLLHGVVEVRAGIEEDHEASLRCFRGAGFVQLNQEPDHEGILNFSYKLSGYES